MTTIDLLAALEEAFPISRQVNIDGFPHPLWVWKVELPELVKLIAEPRETQEEQLAVGLETCVLGVGDEQGNKIFDNERGRKWLSKNPMAVLTLAQAVHQLNEMDGPSDERKKKSASQTSSNACSNSAETSESDTLDD